MRYDFNRSLWALDGKCGGLGIECDNCGKFGQVITKQDIDEAVLISPEEFDQLNFFEKPVEEKISLIDWLNARNKR